MFSHYAPGNCPPPEARLLTLCRGDGRATPAGGAPEPGPYWSLMFEVSESALKPVAQEPAPLGGGAWPAVVAETLAGAVATRMLAPDDQVVSIYHRRAPMWPETCRRNLSEDAEIYSKTPRFVYLLAQE